jgi:hypothetical protein
MPIVTKSYLAAKMRHQSCIAVPISDLNLHEIKILA